MKTLCLKNDSVFKNSFLSDHLLGTRGYWVSVMLQSKDKICSNNFGGWVNFQKLCFSVQFSKKTALSTRWIRYVASWQENTYICISKYFFGLLNSCHKIANKIKTRDLVRVHTGRVQGESNRYSLHNNIHLNFTIHCHFKSLAIFGPKGRPWYKSTVLTRSL